jgi:hypothetical protein
MNFRYRETAKKAIDAGDVKKIAEIPKGHWHRWTLLDACEHAFERQYLEQARVFKRGVQEVLIRRMVETDDGASILIIFMEIYCNRGDIDVVAAVLNILDSLKHNGVVSAGQGRLLLKPSAPLFFFRACQHRYFGLANYLVRLFELDMSDLGEEGRRLENWCVKDGAVDVLEYLIEKGVVIDKHRAVRHAHLLSGVKFLFEKCGGFNEEEANELFSFLPGVLTPDDSRRQLIEWCLQTPEITALLNESSLVYFCSRTKMERQGIPWLAEACNVVGRILAGRGVRLQL